MADQFINLHLYFAIQALLRGEPQKILSDLRAKATRTRARLLARTSDTPLENKAQRPPRAPNHTTRNTQR